jgi:hypothetical protein
MKSKLFIVAMVLLSGLFTAHGGERDIAKIWNDPDPLLKEIRSQIENPNRNHEEDKALAGNIKTLAYAISEELNAADSPNWATPSAERKAVIQKWAKTLAPDTQQLVDLAFGQGFGESRSSVQARSLLDYAPSSPAFADQVRKHINQSLSDSFAAADLLLEHRLLTDADKEALRQLRPAEDREYDLGNWAIGMSSFGMLDGLEIAKKALSKKPQGETPEEITSPYLRFLRMVNNLGPDAAVLLPEIEALIANPKIISSGYLKNFEYAKDVITGKEPRQGRYAVNGSGPLSPWLKSGNFEKSEPSASVSKPSTELKRPAEQKPKLTTPIEESAPLTRWPVVAVVVVAALGLLWLLLKKRK